MIGPFTPRKNENGKVSEAIKEALLNSVLEGLIVAKDTGDVIYSNELGEAIMKDGLFGPIDIVSRNPKVFTYGGREYKTVYERIPENVGIDGVIATLIDTVGIKEQADELAEVKEKLEKANNFKSAFLANMSHEIRTPIHAIIGFAEIILKESIPENLSTQIEMIKDSSYSLLAIINDVLDLSRIESGKMELVCSNYYISYVIRDIEATFSLAASRKGLTFNIHLDDNIPSSLYGDKIRIRGTLINLLNNAVKYTKEGHVDFYIKVLDKKDGLVTLCFEVHDTGIGIKKEDLNRIFDSFARFDIQNNYSVEGRGLGLSIAKGYMDLMGGRIEVSSEYGVGSTFKAIVDQRIIDDSPVDMEIVNARKKKDNKEFVIKNTKTLVVDDNPVNLSVANGLMRSYGMVADKASGGREAISMCINNEYDLIFMDEMMPEVDGVMAMKEIRKISDFYASKCKFVVLTADAIQGVKDRLIDEGFDDYLSKPLEVYRLEEVFHQYISEDNIVAKEQAPYDVITIEEGIPGLKNSATINEEDEIEEIAFGLKMPQDVLEKRIKACGGRLEDYKSICEIAYKHAPSKISKLRESQAAGDYERFTIEVHALKSTLASLGATELCERAKDQEYAGKERRFDYIDKNMDALLNDFEAYMNRVKTVVLNKQDEEEKVSSNEEWSKDEIVQVANKFLALVDEFNFGEIFDILDNINALDMGPQTKSIFSEIENIMNDMDIDALKQKLGDLIS